VDDEGLGRDGDKGDAVRPAEHTRTLEKGQGSVLQKSVAGFQLQANNSQTIHVPDKLFHRAEMVDICWDFLHVKIIMIIIVQ